MSEYCSLKAKPRLEVVYTFCTIHVRTMLEMCQDSPVYSSSKRNTVIFLSHHPSVHHYQSGKELNVFVFGEGVVKDKPSTFKILNNLNMMYKNVANSSEIFNSFCLREEVLPTWKRTDFQGCRDTLSRRYQVGIVLCARKIQKFGSVLNPHWTSLILKPHSP